MNVNQFLIRWGMFFAGWCAAGALMFFEQDKIAWACLMALCCGINSTCSIVTVAETKRNDTKEQGT